MAGTAEAVREVWFCMAGIVMSMLTIPISEEQLERLTTIARQAGVSPEELARVSLEEWLDRPREDFLQAAQYVLKKNAGLYRRLA
jgi:hypothetical protein